MKYIATIIFSVIVEIIFAQAGMWTWMKGDSTVSPADDYGTLGVAAPTNKPRGLYEAAEWKDLQGNFWFFGGLSDGFATYSAMWKYEPLTNNWTWIKGPNYPGDIGTYGTKGVPNINNNPPSRAWGVATWCDLNGDLWLYGGLANSGDYADLWRYNIAANTWTWMHGSNTQGNSPVYGTRKVPSVSNNPGSRYECSATWVDANNNLWLFGGLRYNLFSAYNDLWRYNIATDEWTWMKGSNQFSQPGVYGTKGVADSSNVPGARLAYSSWTDKNGNFWLFGGQDDNAAAYNDMWRYEPATNNWTWMSGTNLAYDNGLYDLLCLADTDNVPTSRTENRCRWTDICGNFWLYGGGRGTSMEEGWSDLWYFNPLMVKWTLVKGTNSSYASPIYGSLGVPSALNQPGARCGTVGWMSSSNELYLFGGTVNGWLLPYNDLWKFTVDTTCLGTSYCSNTACNLTVTCTTSQNIFCSGDSARICVPANFSTYHWNNGQTTNCITAKLAGNYYVTVTDNNGCSAESTHLAITVYPLPPVSISVNGDTLNVYNAVTQQWYLNGSVISGATDSVYIAHTGGSYTVQVTDTNGCFATSLPVIVSGVENMTEDDVVSVWRIAGGGWQLTVGNNFIGSIAEMFDADGAVVFKSFIINRSSLIGADVPRGVYLLRIRSARGSVVRKLVRVQ